MEYIPLFSAGLAPNKPAPGVVVVAVVFLSAVSSFLAPPNSDGIAGVVEVVAGVPEFWLGVSGFFPNNPNAGAPEDAVAVAVADDSGGFEKRLGVAVVVLVDGWFVVG